MVGSSDSIAPANVVLNTIVAESFKEIADQLFIAESTVKSNMKMIFNKLEINSRAELKNFFD